jgi:hypothetical protein
MTFFNRFRQPYLNLDSGSNLGGGGEPTPVSNEPTPSEPSNEPSPTPQGGTEEQPKIKVKYNHQELELPYEEAVTHIQKGMNYEKAIERTKAETAQAARDAYIAEQGYIWNDKPIKTESEYKQALKEKEIYEKYQQQGLPEEVINELVESKKDREERKAEKQSQAEKERKNAEYAEFFEYFKSENGREFNASTDTIPDEVWELTGKGKTLTDAYAIHHTKELKAKIAEYESKLQAQETNSLNASSSPGSVTGNGSAKGDYISFETFEANKGDQRWVIKNLSKINESRTKW